MARRDVINVSTHPAIAKQFRELAQKYSGRLGMCLTAAMLMFMEAHPDVQGSFLKRAFEAQLRDEVEALLAEVRAEQSAKVKAKDKSTKSRDQG